MSKPSLIERIRGSRVWARPSTPISLLISSCLISVGLALYSQRAIYESSAMWGPLSELVTKQEIVAVCLFAGFGLLFSVLLSNRTLAVIFGIVASTVFTAAGVSLFLAVPWSIFNLYVVLAVFSSINAIAMSSGAKWT